MPAVEHRCACQSSYHLSACPASCGCRGEVSNSYPDYSDLLVPAADFSPEETTVETDPTPL